MKEDVEGDGLIEGMARVLGEEQIDTDDLRPAGGGSASGTSKLCRPLPALELKLPAFWWKLPKL